MITIKVKVLTEGCMPKKAAGGDWYDLVCAQDFYLKSPKVAADKVCSFYTWLVPLGVAMELPKGYEAHIVPRSSTYKNYGLLMQNSLGVIDNAYCGDSDQWRFPAVALRSTTVSKGTRLCQFRIALTQDATLWQKIRWLFSRKVRLVRVSSLDNPNRGGFGSTGK